MSSNVLNVTSASFDETVMASEVPVLLDFWAPWCGPCRALNPVMEQLADAFVGRAKIVKVNYDENPQLGERFGVRGVPHLTLINKGETKHNVGSIRTFSNLSKIISACIEGESTKQVIERNLDDPEVRRAYFASATLDQLRDRPQGLRSW